MSARLSYLVVLLASSLCGGAVSFLLGAQKSLALAFVLAPVGGSFVCLCGAFLIYKLGGHVQSSQKTKAKPTLIDVTPALWLQSRK